MLVYSMYSPYGAHTHSYLEALAIFVSERLAGVTGNAVTGRPVR